MKKIKFMNEYSSSSLWHMEFDVDGEIGCIEPESLPITDELINHINEWSAMFDATLNHDYPIESGFENYQAAEKFLQTGHEIAHKLQDELGDKFLIVKSLAENVSELVRS